MDYAKLTLAELRNGISDTKSAIHRCKEALDNLRQPKTVGLQAMADAITHVLPRLEQDLKALPGENLHRQERIEGTTVAQQPMGLTCSWRRTARLDLGEERKQKSFCWICIFLFRNRVRCKPVGPRRERGVGQI
jgi:hypothetical protein